MDRVRERERIRYFIAAPACWLGPPRTNLTCGPSLLRTGSAREREREGPLQVGMLTPVTSDTTGKSGGQIRMQVGGRPVIPKRFIARPFLLCSILKEEEEGTGPARGGR
jgi:hypothetical protein